MTSLSYKDDYFETPDWLFEEIKKKTKLFFDLDFCASEENTKCGAYINEEMDALQHIFKNHSKEDAIFCNPPRSKNKAFMNKLYDDWKKYDLNIVILMCWNDLGNKYGEKIYDEAIKGNIEIHNIGKVKFYKNGKESEFPSRLTYCWVWLK